MFLIIFFAIECQEEKAVAFSSVYRVNKKLCMHNRGNQNIVTVLIAVVLMQILKIKNSISTVYFPSRFSHGEINLPKQRHPFETPSGVSRTVVRASRHKPQSADTYTLLE